MFNVDKVFDVERAGNKRLKDVCGSTGLLASEWEKVPPASEASKPESPIGVQLS